MEKFTDLSEILSLSGRRYYALKMIKWKTHKGLTCCFFFSILNEDITTVILLDFLYNVHQPMSLSIICLFLS